MGDPKRIDTRGGVKTLLGAVAIIAVAALIIGAVLLFVHKIFISIAMALIVIGVALLILALFVGPYYIIKGEKIQINMSYDLDDVKSVKERTGDDKKE